MTREKKIAQLSIKELRDEFRDARTLKEVSERLGITSNGITKDLKKRGYFVGPMIKKEK